MKFKLLMLGCNLLIISCADDVTPNVELVKIEIAIPIDQFYNNTQYTVVKPLIHPDTFFQNNLIALTNRLSESYDFEDINYAFLKDLNNSIDVDFSQSDFLYLILFNSNSIIDFFKIDKSVNTIELKEINRVSSTNTLISNRVNIIDQNVLNLDNLDLTNLILFFESNNTFTLSNSTVDKLLMNFNFKDTFVTLNNISFVNSKFINNNQTIFLENSVTIRDSHFENKLNSDFLLSIINGSLEITNSYITRIPSFLSAGDSQTNFNYVYLKGVTQVGLKSQTDSKIKISNSFFEENETCFETVNADSLIIKSSIFSNNNLVLKNTQSNFDIKNSHFISENGRFIEMVWDFNVNQIGSGAINSSNLMFTSNQFIIEMKSGVRLGSDIMISNSYIDFGVLNPYSRILDGNDIGVNSEAKVVIMNSLNNEIIDIGIN